ncbi:hypothetical protein A2U01_0112918, partial [Trifolium medium]|nr:hypothetical protein [Trifolium medium]
GVQIGLGLAGELNLALVS